MLAAFFGMTGPDTSRIFSIKINFYVFADLYASYAAGPYLQ